MGKRKKRTPKGQCKLKSIRIGTSTFACPENSKLDLPVIAKPAAEGVILLKLKNAAVRGAQKIEVEIHKPRFASEDEMQSKVIDEYRRTGVKQVSTLCARLTILPGEVRSADWCTMDGCFGGTLVLELAATPVLESGGKVYGHLGFSNGPANFKSLPAAHGGLLGVDACWPELKAALKAEGGRTLTFEEIGWRLKSVAETALASAGVEHVDHSSDQFLFLGRLTPSINARADRLREGRSIGAILTGAGAGAASSTSSTSSSSSSSAADAPSSASCTSPPPTKKQRGPRVSAAAAAAASSNADDEDSDFDPML